MVLEKIYYTNLKVEEAVNAEKLQNELIAKK